MALPSLRAAVLLLTILSGMVVRAPTQAAPAPASGGASPPPAPAPPPPGVVVKVVGDLGFVSTAGNSSVQTLNLGDKVTIKMDKILLTQQFSVVHGRSKGETVTSLWRALARGDYALPSVFGSYLSVNYERNTFSGLRSRVVTNGGLTAHVIRQDRMKLSLESGLNITAQRQVAPTTPPIDALGGRAAFAFLRHIGEKAGAIQTVELLPNFKESKKLRINTETTLTAPITKQVGLKLSFVIRYDESPAPTFQTTDRLFTSGITVSF